MGFTDASTPALGDFAFWGLPHARRVEAFRDLRENEPVSFQAEPKPGDRPDGPGFWSVVCYPDMRTVSAQPAIFSNAQGFGFNDVSPRTAELLGSIVAMDDPRHGKLRRLVQAGFTRPAIERLAVAVRDRAHRTVAAAAPLGECDFVEAIAKPFPIGVICEMVGVPAADEATVLELTSRMVDVDLEEQGSTPKEALQALYDYAIALGQDRRDRPRDDIASTLMHAEVDGEQLTPAEFGSFVVLLLAAGNETTRTAISWGTKLLADHPDQRDAWRRDYDALAPNAVEEIIRWASPVLHMRRTTTEPVRLGDVDIGPGEKVVMWYWSANRDEAVFPDGDRFDIARPNARDHVAFGSGGPHFCLGARLARLEATVMFEELFRWLPDLDVTGPPEPIVSPFSNGIRRMPCRFTPREVA